MAARLSTLLPDDIPHQEELLAIYRKKFISLLYQAAYYGCEQAAPLDKINLIADARKNIQQLKDTLRSYDVQTVTETERTRVLRRASFSAELLRGAQVL